MREAATVIVGRAEIAARLGRSEKTISRWIRRGVLACERCGPFDNSRLRVRVDDLDALLERYGAGETA
jgi:hypothetical protein